MTVFEQLLSVQEHDSAVDRLRHRRTNLPERTELATLEDEVAGLERQLAEVTDRRDEVSRRQKRFEDELALVEGKIAEISARLYSGAITIPRELQAMQGEVESLRKRAGSLEDEVLEAMSEREPLDEEIARLEGERARRDAEGGRLRAAIAELETAIDAELAREQTAREEAAATLPADLSALYEQLRTKLDGVGAARLVNGRCSGCHLTLPATEIDRIRKEPPDAVIRCDQCSRILVRP